MSTTPPRSDTADNRRVFTWIIVAVVIVLIGAAIYFFRGTQADGQPGVVGPTMPAPTAPAATGAPVSPTPPTSGAPEPANPAPAPK